MPVTATKPAASPRTRMPWPPASNTTAPGWDKRPPRCRHCVCAVPNSNASVRRLGIKLRRLEAAAKTVTATSVDLRAPVRDTVVLLRRDTLRIRDTLKLFRWRDAWVTVEGRIRTDSVACRVESTDTLRQVVHRIPRRFLFIRWGTKALRQEIVSSNPHTRIVYSDYVKFER